MKKIIVILSLTLVMILMISGCGNNKTSESQTGDNNSTQSSFNSSKDDFNSSSNSVSSQNNIFIDDGSSDEYSTKKSYTHTAICGAVITEQNGGASFKYKGYCEECGETDTITKSLTASSGTYKSGFLCENCGNQQEIEIATY